MAEPADATYIPQFLSRKMTAVVIDEDHPKGFKTTISNINEAVTRQAAWDITRALYALTEFEFDYGIETVATQMEEK